MFKILTGRPPLDMSHTVTRSLPGISSKRATEMTLGANSRTQFPLLDPFELGMQNMHLIRGIRLTVPRGTRKVWIPRTHHYAPKVYNDIEHEARIEKFGADLNPCLVTRSIITGFGWHRCPYHIVYIEEAPKTNGPVVSNKLGPAR